MNDVTFLGTLEYTNYVKHTNYAMVNSVKMKMLLHVEKYPKNRADIVYVKYSYYARDTAISDMHCKLLQLEC